MAEHADLAVIGGGIVGLAHAWSAARRGKRVLLFERTAAAQGASIRNFGMIWPIGQPAGPLYALAMRSRELWLDAAKATGLWLNPCGSLHLARRKDELAVLEEFAAAASAERPCEVLSAAEACDRSPAVRRDGLLGALWSPTEQCVDPRQALRLLPRWLHEGLRVEMHYQTTISHAESTRLTAADGRSWHAEQTIICSGADFETLFPEASAAAGLRRCKLQMLRTVAQPGGWRLGPHLAGGLTLRHYASFEACPSLPALKRRIANENPELDRYGIHVMAAQNEAGEVLLGDSHEYDQSIEPFDKQQIDELILVELRKLLELLDWTIAQRWHGIYARHATEPVFSVEVAPNVTIFSATGGAGMTLAFGLAEQFWQSR
ncbi:MAG TPA: TIGR03364 family FAD-dependent oxidoreductase [Pirellulales bacterium]|jgi:FAD dependent oxidoreductase TIGR03364|nr:TIGR03364 family FAD-dependent oxidoreductase [Pirellulales bacterium]